MSQAKKKVWKKSPPELVETFQQATGGDARIEHRKMFGYPCCFVNGNMFTGLHEDRMVLRLPEADREEFLEIEGAVGFEPWPGRRMKEYVVVPDEKLGDRDFLQDWIDRSLEYTASLPKKEKKKK